MEFRRFLTVLAITFAVVTCSVAALNFAIDPYGLFGTPLTTGINELKPTAGTRMRLIKAYQVLRARPKTLIVGNSRLEMGIDPSSSCWNDEFQPVYNLAIPGARVYHQTRYVQHALVTDTVRNVFLGVDFFDFLYRHDVAQDFSTWPTSPMTFESHLVVTRSGQKNYAYGAQKILDYLNGLFSLEAMEDSIATLARQNELNSSTRTVDGFNPAREYLDIIAAEGQEVLFRHQNEKIRQDYANPELALYQAGTNWSTQFESVKRMLTDAISEGVNVTLFISPYHAEYMIAVEQAGQWPALEAWKREMTALAEQYDDVAIWDFNQFSPFTTETPPRRGETGTTLRWFWEPEHYSAELGNLLLANMLARDCGNPPGQTVGSILTSATLESHLQDLRTAMTRYKKEHPAVMERLSGTRPDGVESR